MRTLHHLFSSPLWRNVPVALAEKVGERRPEFLALNPAGEVPSAAGTTFQGGAWRDCTGQA
jgi:glutathione S-transferase